MFGLLGELGEQFECLGCRCVRIADGVQRVVVADAEGDELEAVAQRKR